MNDDRCPENLSSTWNGELILACRKCQKKLKGSGELHGLAKLKKTIKRHNKQHPNRLLDVINVSCMDLCPRDGVTICRPAHDSSSLCILRSDADLERLICHQ